MRKLILSLFFLCLVISCNEDDIITNNTPSYNFESLSVKIISPENLTIIKPEDSRIITAEIQGDSIANKSNFKIEWKSSVDGVLSSKTLDSLKQNFNTKNLSRNIHNISFSITNEMDSIVSDSITIFNVIKLDSIKKTNNSNILKWSSTNLASFKSFELRRSTSPNNLTNGTLIYESNNKNDTTFIDITSTLGREYYYQVRINLDHPKFKNIGSNIETIVTGVFLEINQPIIKLLFDEEKNYCYAISNLRSVFDDNKNGYGLFFIDLKTFKIDKRILNNTRFSDLEFDSGKRNLYLSSRSNTIHKVNLENKTLTKTIDLFRSAHKIEISKNDKRLYYHLTPPTSGSTQFMIYDLENEKDIPYKSLDPASFNNYSHGDFELDDNNFIIHGENNTSGPNITKISTVNDSFKIEKQIKIDDGSLNLKLINNKILFGKGIYGSNLNRLGRFIDNNQNYSALDATKNTDLVITNGSRIFSTKDYTVFKNLPAFYNTAVFLNENTVLLIENTDVSYQNYTSKIYIYTFK